MNDGLQDLSKPSALAGDLKAWVRFVGTSGVIQSAYRVRKVTRTGAGLYTVDLDYGFDDTNYLVIGNAVLSGSSYPLVVIGTGATTTQRNVRVVGITLAGAVALVDAPEVHLAFFGKPPAS